MQWTSAPFTYCSGWWWCSMRPFYPRQRIEIEFLLFTVGDAGRSIRSPLQQARKKNDIGENFQEFLGLSDSWFLGSQVILCSLVFFLGFPVSLFPRFLCCHCVAYLPFNYCSRRSIIWVSRLILLIGRGRRHLPRAIGALMVQPSYKLWLTEAISGTELLSPNGNEIGNLSRNLG